MSKNAAIVSGIILIQLVTVMWGGGFLLEQTISRASGFIDDAAVAGLQRAGHGHPGVLCLLALWAQLGIDRVRLRPVAEWSLRLAFPVAALMMSVGFFMSAAVAANSGTDPSIVLRIGAVLLGLSLLSLAALLFLRRRD